MKKKILLGPSSFAETDKTPLNKLAKAGYEVIHNPYKRKLSLTELKNLISQEVVGIIAGLEPLTQESLQNTNIKVVSRVGSGLSNVDLEFCKQAGITVCSTPNGPTQAVAELTIGALLSLLRSIPLMNADMHNGHWNKKIGIQLSGKTVLIIGYGRIGQRVAQLLRPFNVQIIVVDPFLNSTSLSDEKLLPLHQALPAADIITFHNSGESCLIGESEIKLMKQGVYLLNVARGGIIAESALVEGLKNNKISGAWIDTFEQEPYEGILKSFSQVILTPHVGSYTNECRISMENESVENLLAAMPPLS